MLGEMMLTGPAPGGRACTLRGTVAYVPQQAWIFNATVRENILFGQPFDQARYDEAVRVSALVPLIFFF